MIIRTGAFLLLLILLASCNQTAQTASEEESLSVEPDMIRSPEAELERLTRYIEASPSNWGLYKERAMLHFQMDKLDWAIYDIREAIKLKDDDPELHYLRGFFALAQDDTSLARSEFQLASIYGSNNPDVFYQQGQMRFLQQKYEAALKSYEEAARLDSLDPIYPFAKGFLERSRGNVQKAIGHFEEALALDPNHEKTLLQLHDTYLEDLKQPEKAREYNQRLLAQNPRHSLANYNEGSYHYRKAVPLKSSQPKAYQEEINQAVEAYTLAIGYSDSFPLPYVYRGMCYVEGERYDLALEDFKKAVELDETQYLAHYQLAALYEFYEEDEKAQVHFEKARAGGIE